MKDFFNNGKRKQEREINYLSQKEIKRLFEAIKNSENKFKLRDLALFTVIYLG
jgi:site-specific recombinase XerD